MSFLVFSLPLLFSSDVENNHEINNVFLFYDSWYESGNNVFKKFHSSSITCSYEVKPTSLFWRVSSLVRFSCNFILRKGEVIWCRIIWRIKESFLGKPYLCRTCHKANFAQDDVSQISIRWKLKLHVVD